MDITGLITVFFIAVLSGLGVGSGGLLIVYLTAVYSVGQLEAQSTNLVFFVFAAGASLMLHYSRRAPRPRELFPIAAGGVLGSFLGARTAAGAEPKALSQAFGVLLIISGSITLYREAKKYLKKRKEKKRE